MIKKELIKIKEKRCDEKNDDNSNLQIFFRHLFGRWNKMLSYASSQKEVLFHFVGILPLLRCD
jgi:hypothetical protein